MERNDKINFGKIDKRAENIIKKVLKKLELLENTQLNSKAFYVTNKESEYLH